MMEWTAVLAVLIVIIVIVYKRSNRNGYRIPENISVALTGNIGSGKSTLMSVIAGNVELDSGNRILNTSVVFGEMYQQTIVEKNIN